MIKENDSKKTQGLSFGMSLLAFLFVMTVLVVGVLVYKVKMPVLLFACWLIVIPFGLAAKVPYQVQAEGAAEMVKRGLDGITIILAVGAMVGAWISAGTVQALINVGLEIINPNIFLVSTLLLCSIVSLFTGTSWGTIGTAGIAMMGVGAGLGMPPGLTAGAIICGAYFGDKMSPLSDTTNMAPAISGATVTEHVRHMVYTTVPAYVITAVIFLVLGFKYNAGGGDLSSVSQLTGAIKSVCKVGFPAFIPAICVITLLVMQKPAFPSIFIGALIGVAIAVFYQGIDLNEAIKSMYFGFSGEFNNDFLNKLLNRGGMTSMYELTAIMIAGLGLGGLLDKSTILPTVLNRVGNHIHSVGVLTVVTMLVSYLAYAVGGSHAFTHVLTGTLMRPLYFKFNLHPKNLSRTMEDSGTLIAPAIPWGGSAVYCATMLQVPTMTYLPFLFLTFIVPIFSILYGFTGKFIEYISPEDAEGRFKEDLEEAKF